jgi:hypothetical protein
MNNYLCKKKELEWVFVIKRGEKKGKFLYKEEEESGT